MNKQRLQELANSWVRCAKSDIKEKIQELVEKNNTTPQELAYVLSISENDLMHALDGDGDLDLLTFAKLMMASGNVLSIQPIENAPQPFMDEQKPRRPHRKFFDLDEPPSFGRPTAMAPLRRAIPTPFVDEEEFLDNMRRRNFCGHSPSCSNEPPKKESPFRSMDRMSLIRIIEDKLWDSEINTATATIDSLVEFLEEKDRKIEEIRKRHQAENEEEAKFKDMVKKSINRNPKLKNWLKETLA